MSSSVVRINRKGRGERGRRLSKLDRHGDAASSRGRAKGTLRTYKLFAHWARALSGEGISSIEV